MTSNEFYKSLTNEQKDYLNRVYFHFFKNVKDYDHVAPVASSIMDELSAIRENVANKAQQNLK